MDDCDRLSFEEELWLGSLLELDPDDRTVCDFTGCASWATALAPGVAMCQRHRDESTVDDGGFLRWKVGVGALTWDQTWRQQRYDDYTRKLAELRAQDGGVPRTPERDAMLAELIRIAVDHLIRDAGAVP
jgi:hypothetical protein